MEKPAAFDLNRALHNWRTQLADSSSVNRENLDELETHLRDSIGRLCKAGLSEQEAWIIAEMRIGQTKALGEEFEKVQPPVRRRGLSEKQFIGALLGVFAVLTGVLCYFDPPRDFMHWMDRISEPERFRNHLYERYGLALPSVQDLKIACIAVFAFLAAVAVYMLLRDGKKRLRIKLKHLILAAAVFMAGLVLGYRPGLDEGNLAAPRVSWQHTNVTDVRSWMSDPRIMALLRDGWKISELEQEPPWVGGANRPERTNFRFRRTVTN